MYYIIGQIMGIIAVVLGFISFQMKTKQGILIFQILTAFVFSIHYLLIGAMTAVGLNLLSAVKSICYYYRDKKNDKGVLVPIIFISLISLSGFLTWEGWYSALVMIGLIINAFSLAFFDANRIRISNFIKSPICLIYNFIVNSGGGIIYECAVLISSLIGILKTSKYNKEST